MAVKRLGSCCYVFDQKYGCIAICVYVFIYSIFCFICVFNAGDVRLQSGGYNPTTNNVQIYYGILGILMAWAGINGIVEDSVPYLRTFNTYQWGKLLVNVVVFVADLQTLMKCETWVSTIESQTHYNITLENISRNGLCSAARLSYIFGFLIDFCINVYFTYMVADYCRKLACHPAYVVEFPGDERKARDVRTLHWFDEKLGEPYQYLGDPVRRASHTHGSSYGAMGAMEP